MKKSVIDYVIVNKEDIKYLNKMIIDENKEMTPYHIVDNRTIYSDHCATQISMNWLIANKMIIVKAQMSLTAKH